MGPGKFYFIYKNLKYYVSEISILKEPETGRNYQLREPFIYKGMLTFITPRNYLQINKAINDGQEIDPVSLVKSI